MKTNKAILKERILRKYAEFKANMLSCDPRDIFELSRQITATTDVLAFVDLIDEDDAVYLLQFKDPLTLLADAWEDYLENETGGDFLTVLYDVLDDDEPEYEQSLLDRHESELKEIVEIAMEQGKICALCRLKSMLDELFDGCEECEHWGPDID